MTILTASSKEADVTTEASYAIALNIARSKCPYTDGEFMKENTSRVDSILDPSKKIFQHLISQMALSKQTIVHQNGDLIANVTTSLTNDLASLIAFRIALDGSTDVQDNPQLAVFGHYVLRKNCLT